MLPVIFFALSDPLFVTVKFHEDHRCHKIEVNMATLSFENIAGFIAVVSVV